jgi:hypothetical protein
LKVWRNFLAKDLAMSFFSVPMFYDLAILICIFLLSSSSFLL